MRASNYGHVGGMGSGERDRRSEWESTGQHVPGWFDFEDIYQQAVREVGRSGRFLEIGSWLGRSTCFLAKAVAESGKNVRISVIDTFQGIPGDELQPLLTEYGGSVETVFRENLKRAGVSDLVDVIAENSRSAHRHFEDSSLDFVFIDGDHSYEGIRADILNFARKVKPGGILAGHDYRYSDSVRKAVDELLGPCPASTASWMVRRPKSIGGQASIWYQTGLPAPDMPLGLGVANRVSVVIVTFNSGATIQACLQSLLPELGATDEVIVVDNASSDKTVDVLAHLQTSDSRIQVLRSMDNEGYSVAANRAILASTGEFVLLLNPDSLLTGGAVELLRLRLSEAQVATVGPLSNYVAGTQNIGHHLPPSLIQRFSQTETAAWLAEHTSRQMINTKLLIGFCMMIRRNALDEVGLLDEDLFLGSDDLDLCWRLRLAGYKLAIACDAYVAHIGQQSFKTLPEGEGERLLAESTAAFKRKLAKFYAPNPIPPSEELFGIPILPRD